MQKNYVRANDNVALLLNRAWVPVNTISARAAFTHLFKKRATVLDADGALFHSLPTWESHATLYEDQPFLQGASHAFPLPTIVIITSRFFKRPKKKKLTLYDLAKVYDFKCQYCLSKFKIKDLTIDHIHPKSLGGVDDHENRTLACRSCNSRKSNYLDWKDVNGNVPTAPPIPSFLLDPDKVREEWKPFLKL